MIKATFISLRADSASNSSLDIQLNGSAGTSGISLSKTQNFEIYILFISATSEMTGVLMLSWPGRASV